MLGTAINSLDTLKVLDLSFLYDNFAATLLAQLGGVLPRLQHLKLVARVHQTNDPRDVFSRAVCNALDLAVELESFTFWASGGWDGRKVFVERAVLDHLLQILQQRTKLRSLAPGCEEMTQVVNLLGPNYHLEELACSCNDVFASCDVFEALGTNSTLTFLDIDVACGDDDALFLQGLERLGSLLPEMNTLKKLSVFCDDYFRYIQKIPKALIRGFELNTSLVDVCFHEMIEGKEKAAIEFFATRNKYRSRLEAASKAEMLTIFVEMLEECEEREEHKESGLSVVFETLRARDEWFDVVES